MIRIQHPPRLNWQEEVERFGLLYHTFQGEPYWFEAAHYELSVEEVDVLELATEELHRICLEAVDTVIRSRNFEPFRIQPALWEVIEWSWENQRPGLYGRFDLGWDGISAPKMYEYNADTPTALLEAAVIQWQWLQQIEPTADQFNSIYEGLIETWRTLDAAGRVPEKKVWMAFDEETEDWMTVVCLQETAQQAGLEPESIILDDIGWNHDRGRFVDLLDRDMTCIFKLYPYEWLVKDEFAGAFLNTYRENSWLEPIWKMILSNKAILAVLWELFPKHPNLLPASLEPPADRRGTVRKPIFGREGANVTVDGGPETAGSYGAEGFVYQAKLDVPTYDGYHPVFGSWVIGDEPRGIGIRESLSFVTDDKAHFVPHLFRP